MFRLVLPILKNTDQTKSMQDLGLEIDYNNCDIFDVIFYQIIAIVKIYEDGKYWTETFVSGDKFISPLPTEEIDQLIQDQFKLSNFSL